MAHVVGTHPASSNKRFWRLPPQAIDAGTSGFVSEFAPDWACLFSLGVESLRICKAAHLNSTCKYRQDECCQATDCDQTCQSPKNLHKRSNKESQLALA